MLFKFPTYQETLGECVGPTVNSEGRSINLGSELNFRGGRVFSFFFFFFCSLEKIYCGKKRAQMI